MKFLTNTIKNINSDTIICFMFEDENKGCPICQYLDEISKGEISLQKEMGIVTGKYLETQKFAINNKLKIIMTGLGKYSELTEKRLSTAIATAAREAKKICKNASIAIELIEEVKEKFDLKQIAIISIAALGIGLYDFDKYLSVKKSKVEKIELITDKTDKEIDRGVQIGAYILHAMKFTKDLVNEQAQIATPEYISEIAQEVAKNNNIEIKVFNKNEIKKMNMNAFLAVAQGSINEPRFIHLTYKPEKTPRKKVALVGKGITFDAGGMNIKPATSMLNMKDDMTGAASVLGIIQAIAGLKSDIELHVVSALCENMTSGKAYKQGDVLKAMNGKTIEVDNTDAEGRITLADALSYCDSLGVDEVIDIATLTGAVIVSLGNNITGVMGNNQQQIDKFLIAAKKSGENVWQMPIFDELKDNLKSEIADMKNTGGRNAGTSTAAWFLSNFTKSSCWMHLDIAGTAYLDKSNKETVFGPTGVMIRSLINYLIS